MKQGNVTGFDPLVTGQPEQLFVPGHTPSGESFPGPAIRLYRFKYRVTSDWRNP
ncbi:hypothetical protein [Fibrella forsythiae]|uniref:Uncharacterized protein n=1 Tax=Fibrella forsythiae TaxID=2817061 RepID=A0ABS3JM18_9BACT|nr:hypothetical protein [Fibrella forsythiae]MBO0951050.1 hypothetical protein [Fibrella forsythiae]